MGRMRFLLDTHALLWWLFDDPKLSSTARDLVGDPAHEILVSSASAWEISTKHRLGKLPGAGVLAAGPSRPIRPHAGGPKCLGEPARDQPRQSTGGLRDQARVVSSSSLHDRGPLGVSRRAAKPVFPSALENPL